MGLLGTTPPPSPTPAPNPTTPLPGTFRPNVGLATPGSQILPGSPTTQPPVGLAPVGSTIQPTSPSTILAPSTTTPGTNPSLPSVYTPTNFGPAPSGYDTTKWNDPNYHDPKYDIGRTYQAGVLSGAPLATIVQNIQSLYPGTTWNGGDVITVPGIGAVDFIRDYGPGGANGISWNPLDASASPTSTTAPSLTPTTSGTTSDLSASGIGAVAPTPVSAGTPSTASGTGDDAISAQYRQAILNLLQTPQTVDPATLATSPEAQAYDIQAQRSTDAQQANLAETAAANGYNGSGAEAAQSQGLRQAQGEGEASFLGQLAITKMQQQQQQLQEGVQFAMANNQFDEAQALQLKLANLNAAIQQAQLAQQQNQFNDTLGYDYTALQLGANANAFNAVA